MGTFVFLLLLGTSGLTHAGAPKKPKLIPAARAVKKAKKYDGCHWLMANYSGSTLKKSRRYIDLKPRYAKLGKHAYDLRGRKNRMAGKTMLESCARILEFDAGKIHQDSLIGSYHVWRQNIAFAPWAYPLGVALVITTPVLWQADLHKKKFKKHMQALRKRADQLATKQREAANQSQDACISGLNGHPRELAELKRVTIACADYSAAIEPEVPWLASHKKTFKEYESAINTLTIDAVVAEVTDLKRKCRPENNDFPNSVSACWAVWEYYRRSEAELRERWKDNHIDELKGKIAKLISHRESQIFSAIQNRQIDRAAQMATELSTVILNRSETQFSLWDSKNQANALTIKRATAPRRSDCGLLNRVYAEYARTGKYGGMGPMDYSKLEPLVQYIGRPHVCGAAAVAHTKKELERTEEIVAIAKSAKLVGRYVCVGSGGPSVLKLAADKTYLLTSGNDWDSGTWRRNDTMLVTDIKRTSEGSLFYDQRIGKQRVYEISGDTLIINGRMSSWLCKRPY